MEPSKTVSITIRSNGRKLDSKHPYPFRQYSQTVELSPEDAEALVDQFRDMAKAKKQPAKA